MVPNATIMVSAPSFKLTRCQRLLEWHTPAAGSSFFPFPVPL